MKQIFVAALIILILSLPSEVQATDLLKPPKLQYTQAKEEIIDVDVKYKFYTDKYHLDDFYFYTDEVKFKFFRKVSMIAFRRALGSKIRADFEYYQLNSLHPYRARREYQEFFPEVVTNYDTFSWIGSPVLKRGPIELTDTGIVQSKVSLKKLNRFDFLQLGVLKTRFSFQVKVNHSGFVKSFGARATKKFTIFSYSAELRASFKYRIKQDALSAEFNLRIV